MNFLWYYDLSLQRLRDTYVASASAIKEEVMQYVHGVQGRFDAYCERQV
jgi:hypothetical protein